MRKVACVSCILLAHLSLCFASASTSSGKRSQSSRISRPSPKKVTARFAAPIGYVNDFAGVVDESTRRRLEKTLINLKVRSGIEFKLVTVTSSGGQDIFEFSRQMANDWNVSLRNTRTKTLLLVVAVREKTLFTQFTKAAQAELPDGILGEIRQRMQEPINSGRFSDGLANGIQYFVSALAKKIGFSIKGIDESDLPPAVFSLPIARSDLNKFFKTTPAHLPIRSNLEDVAILKPIAVPTGTESKVKFAPATPEPVTSQPPAERLPNKPESTVGPEGPAKESTLTLTPSPARTENTALVDKYRVGNGDVLTISLLNAPTNRSTLYTVSDGGLIDFPLAGGSVAVAGLTTNEIQALLELELKRRSVHEDPGMTVGVRQYSSHVVTVTGMVNHQGIRALKGERVPLYVIISEVQPVAEAGRITIMRAGSMTSALDLHDPAALSFQVQSGDVINVTQRPQEFYYIGGRINRPGQKSFQPGMTLLQAILAAGGLSRPADHKIELLREGVDGKLKSLSFDLRDIKSGKVPDPRIQSGDSLEIVD